MKKQTTPNRCPLAVLDAILGALQIGVLAIAIVALPALAVYADKHIKDTKAKQSLEALNAAQ